MVLSFDFMWYECIQPHEAFTIAQGTTLCMYVGLRLSGSCLVMFYVCVQRAKHCSIINQLLRCATVSPLQNYKYI